MKSLFNNNQSKAVLAQFKSKIDAMIPSGEFETQRNSLIRLVVSAMETNPEEWDRMCQINIQWIGGQFINRLSEDGELDKERLDDMAAICFRFLFELYLSTKNDLSIEFERARQFVSKNVDSFELNAKEQIEYAIREMPISIFKQIANSKEINSIKEFNSVAAKVDDKREEWEKDLNNKEKKVESLKRSLQNYENGFNFVGLFQGFDDLSKEKVAEKNSILFWLRFVSFFIFIPIISELLVVYHHIDKISAVREGLLLSFLPAISFVGIAIYYFRVLLFNYKSVKSQLLQIDLRKTLCRFIQHYSEYSSEIKKNDSESLSRFEHIIFSGIVTEEGKIPSTYDGIEEIAKLIKSAKS